MRPTPSVSEAQPDGRGDLPDERIRSRAPVRLVRTLAEDGVGQVVQPPTHAQDDDEGDHQQSGCDHRCGGTCPGERRWHHHRNLGCRGGQPVREGPGRVVHDDLLGEEVARRGLLAEHWKAE
jgi:hypothetical protein